MLARCSPYLKACLIYIAAILKNNLSDQIFISLQHAKRYWLLAKNTNHEKPTVALCSAGILRKRETCIGHDI